MKTQMKRCDILVDLCVQWELLLVYENVDPHADALIKHRLSLFVAWWGDDDDFVRWWGSRRRGRTRRHLWWKWRAQSAIAQHAGRGSSGVSIRRKSHMEAEMKYPRAGGPDECEPSDYQVGVMLAPRVHVTTDAGRALFIYFLTTQEVIT